MYYKFVSDAKIVDACDGLNYVHWQEKNRIFLSCDADHADGIVSSNGTTIYLLEGAPQIGAYSYAAVTEISFEEYQVLRDELDAGGDIPDKGDEPEPDTPARTRLQILEQQVAMLEEANFMLTECLLEMSEVVYGDDY